MADILTTAQNIAQALNTIVQTILNIQGAVTTANIIAPTIVKPTPGRLATVSVIDAGSADGLIYDTNSASATDRPIYVIPTADGVGVVFVNMPFGYGLRVDPGTDQVISVSYS